MATTNDIQCIFFAGIGGIGMSALARHFHNEGVKVYGYDRGHSVVTSQLEALGIGIVYEDNPALLPDGINLVVYTPALPPHHAQLNYLRNKGIPIVKRAEILGRITRERFTIAVAGTHGKTTISSMTAHILKTAGTDMTAFLGGLVKTYDSNYFSGTAKSIVVAEADEYDRSFLQLSPDIAVISAMDADHLDIYGTHESMIEAYNEFIAKGKSGMRLLVNEAYAHLADKSKCQTYTYGRNHESSFYAADVSVRAGGYDFTLACPGGELIQNMRLNIGGQHNIDNAVAAAAACKLFGTDNDAIRKGIASFPGVVRRFDVRIKNDKLVYIDDYAHHPEELRRFIESVRELYPGKHVTGVFQPHLYSRTRDFAEGFAASLSLLDTAILLDIYPAREEPMPGVTSTLILDKISHARKMLCSKDKLIEELIMQKTEVILTIGAGDIDGLVSPIEKSFTNLLKFMQS